MGAVLGLAFRAEAWWASVGVVGFDRTAAVILKVGRTGNETVVM